MTKEQMKLIYIIFREISKQLNIDVKVVKQEFKKSFGNKKQIKEFSLSYKNGMCLDILQTREFLQMLIDFCLLRGVKIKVFQKDKEKHCYIQDLIPEIKQYLFVCLKEKMCAITNKKENVVLYDFTNNKVIKNLKTNIELIPLNINFINKIKNKNDFLEFYHLETIILNEKEIEKLRKWWKDGR